MVSSVSLDAVAEMEPERPAHPTLRWTTLIVALAALGFLGFGAALVAGGHTAYPMGIWELRIVWSHILSTMGYPLLALLIVLFAARWKGALMIGLTFALVGLSQGLVPLGASYWPGLVPLVNALTFTLGAVAVVRAGQLFPAELSPETLRRTRLGRVLRPLLGAIPVWIGLGGAFLVALLTLPGFAYHLLRVSSPLLALCFFWCGYRAADEQGRRRLYWFLLGVVFFVGCAVLILSLHGFIALTGARPPDSVLRVTTHALFGLSALGVVGCSAVAIFYAGAIDPRLAIRRTVVFGAITPAMVLLSGMVEQLISTMVADSLGFRGTVSATLAGTSIGLLFRPVHDVLDRKVGTWMRARLQSEVPA